MTLVFLGLNNWCDVFHTPKSDECILVLCVALGHYEILACPLIRFHKGERPTFTLSIVLHVQFMPYY